MLVVVLLTFKFNDQIRNKVKARYHLVQLTLCYPYLENKRTSYIFQKWNVYNKAEDQNQKTKIKYLINCQYSS